jgi:alginate O-acetyltransferase complex protein AlgI
VLGTAQLFGIQLMENFAAPLTRTSLSDFWRSWHISLTSWVRDYVYYPVLMTLRNTEVALLATMLVIGVWHGPKLGWMLWGLHHATGLIVLSRWTRWLNARPELLAMRQSVWWRGAGLAGVWAWVSMAYVLTLEARGTSGGLLYLRIVTLDGLGR